MVNPHLTHLETSGLIQLAQEHPELEYLFRHALVQDAAYGSLLLSDRKQMHSTVAQVLEQIFGEQLDEMAAVIGYHWQLAQEPQKALSYFMQAGDVAAKAYANDEAVEHYGRSLTLAQQTVADSNTLVHLCTALGRVLELQSNYQQALAHYQAMGQLADQYSNQTLALAALMGRTNLHVTVTPLNDLVLGESLAQEAMALAKALDDQPAQIHLLWSMINFHFFSARPEKAIAMGREALLLARKQGVIETEAYILNDLAQCLYNRGHIHESAKMAAEVRRLWQELNNLPMLINSLGLSSQVAYFQGNYAQSITLGKEGFNLGQAIGNPFAQAYAGAFAGLAYWKVGQASAGITRLKTCLQLAETVHFSLNQLVSNAYLALILNDLGDRDEALTRAQLAQKLVEQEWPTARVLIQGILILIQIGQGDLIAADTLIQQIKSEAFYVAQIGDISLIHLAEAMWLFKNGRYVQALTFIESHLATIHGQEATGFHPNYLFLKAQILIKTNQLVAAHAALQEAQTLARTQNNRQLLWQILAEEAMLLTTLGEPEMAQRLRQQIRHILTEIIANIPDEYRDSFRERVDVTAVLQTP